MTQVLDSRSGKYYEFSEPADRAVLLAHYLVRPDPIEDESLYDMSLIERGRHTCWCGLFSASWEENSEDE